MKDTKVIVTLKESKSKTHISSYVEIETNYIGHANEEYGNKLCLEYAITLIDQLPKIKENVYLLPDGRAIVLAVCPNIKDALGFAAVDKKGDKLNGQETN